MEGVGVYNVRQSGSKLPDDHQMQNDKKGTLLMLDSGLRELPPPIAPRPGSRFPAPALNGNVAGEMEANPKNAEPEKGDKPGAGKGHKKGKQARHRAKVDEDLSRISAALRELRGRVSDLHALQLDREGRTAGLATRMDTLGAEQGMARELTVALDGRVSALGAKVDALRAEAAVITDALADLAVQPDRDTALFALEDRIQEAEETLTGLRAFAEQQQMTETPDALAERLDLLGQELVPLTARLNALEGRVVQDGTGGSALVQFEQGLGVLSASVDDRTAGLERDLATLRDQNKRWREAERAWAEERLNGVRQGLVGGMALLGLLLLAGFVATWWHGERQLDLIAARISAVEQDTGERVAALAAPSGQADDRLGSALSDLGAAMQGVQATNVELGATLAALSAARAEPAPARAPVSDDPSLADLLARLRVLEEGRRTAVAAGDGTGGAAGRSEAETGSDAQAGVGSVSQNQSRSELAVPLVDGAQSDTTGDIAHGPGEDQNASAGSKAESIPAADPVVAVAPPVAATAAPPEVEKAVDAAPAQTDVADPPEVAGAAAAGRYSLQLIGFRTEASIAPFAREHGIVGEARWIRTQGKGRDWYLVLFGDYASRQDAQEAVASLPSDLQGLSPLVRPLPDGAQPLTPQ